MSFVEQQTTEMLWLPINKTGRHEESHLSVNISPDKQAYFEQVWKFVRQVPCGKVVTYGQIAQSLPEPLALIQEEQEVSAARLVGSAMAACPADVPWHRVINAQGKVSSRADTSKQIRLLETEGLCFLQGRINLKEHQWPGPNHADQPKQHQLF